MPNAVRTLVVLAFFIVGCSAEKALEENAASRLVACMAGNGGVDATEVRFSLDGQRIEQVELSYLGKGSSAYDAVYEDCLQRVADDLDLLTE